MANKRISELTREVTTPEDDDYLVLDSKTKGTGKMAAGKNGAFALREDDNIKCNVVTTNPEYVYAITDSDGKFLFGIKAVDGSLDFGGDFPEKIKAAISQKVDKVEGESLVNSSFANGVSVISNTEFCFALVDAEGKILFGVRQNGNVEWFSGIPTALKEFTEIQISKNDNEFVYALTDNEDKIIFGIDRNGRVVFNSSVMLDCGLKLSRDGFSKIAKSLDGFKTCGDYSFKDSARIAIPKKAVLNFYGFKTFPTLKSANLRGNLQFFDNNGNYFDKKVIVNAQGSSSLAFEKKNVAIDICNDEWIGDDTFSLKLGDWVAQDSFHIKAYYTDFFRGIACIGYNLYKEIVDNAHDFSSDRTWKRCIEHNSDWFGLGNSTEDIKSRIDNGALCFPMGFPCEVYIEGEFKGIYAFNLKKHRDNYMMDKSDTRHIHLDPDDYFSEDKFFGGIIDWTKFEVRNPKSLLTMDGSNYDGDNPKELMDSTSSAYDASNKKCVNTAAVKSRILALSTDMDSVNAASSDDEKKSLFEKFFDVDGIIDYIIFSDFVYNHDGFARNWQWTTWNGEKWAVNPYDLDGIFGAYHNGDCIISPLGTHIYKNVSTSPVKFVIEKYSATLNARYKLLRDNGVLSAQNVVNKVSAWMKTLGLDMYKDEYDIWSDSPCNRNMVVNENWELVTDDDGKPTISTSYNYSSSKTYEAGDTCTYNVITYARWNYTFICKTGCTGEAPIAEGGFKDSVWRVQKWVESNLEKLDKIYNYN